ncbi:hypothetical protein Tco_1412949, partial [Tanacetum coccineum]
MGLRTEDLDDVGVANSRLRRLKSLMLMIVVLIKRATSDSGWFRDHHC